MSFEFDFPREERSIIKVIGVGGGGSNAVSHMFKQGIVGVDFAICNTDSQSMDHSPVDTKIQLGPQLTEGRGAGSKPDIGKEACIESIEEVRQFLEENTKMLFITAGMGGGTGTGAAPIIAKAAKEMDILTVGIVTVPFTFEGRRRAAQAGEGIENLEKNVDALIIISNDKLREIHGNLALSDAFGHADDILTTAAKGIAEIITVPGYVNVDFEDVNTVMRESGVAIMGTAVAEGDDRARKAIDQALNSPLLEDNDIRGARHILLNISSGDKEVTMDEIFEITEFVQEEAGYGTDLIWGNCHDETMGDKICVTLIATGFVRKSGIVKQEEEENDKIIVPLDEEEDLQSTRNEIFEVSVEEGAETTTIEFDDVEDTVRSLSKRAYTYRDPYVKMESGERKSDNKPLSKSREDRNAQIQRKSTVKLNKETIVELENEPAYVRRRIELEDVPDAEETDVSRWSIGGEDEEPVIRQDNSYLHDNVD